MTPTLSADHEQEPHWARSAIVVVDRSISSTIFFDGYMMIKVFKASASMRRV